ncbi:c-type cytochrome [Profundibacterium mesophilum]|uniref:Cytochrome c class II n=1 Tax=Profundibacterium mesophilum KAUST100406-0324 TaxID=1037889 RepID=A0A921NUI2_9RHOB|nr:cytochrome c [Profundibacterium mesophilum]KAF0675760.1 Cytochrome c class II [Profundibacterium mesophilum KAUST100406-0324]
MNIKIGIIAALAGTIAVAATAHNGATGIVLERMQGMSAMKKAVARIAPMMRGEQDYDAAAVASAAQVIGNHAGTALTDLFPEDGSREKSLATDAVWTNWEEFERLSEQLARLAGALEQAAPRGTGSASASGGGSASDMMGAGGMMGGGMSGGAAGMMGGGAAPVDAAALADLPAGEIFAQIAKTCAACHSSFRSKSD